MMSVPLAKSPERIQVADRTIEWVSAHSVTLLRISMGIIFFWFGVLKFFPGTSPAEILAGKTIQQLSLGTLKPAVSLPLIAALECGLGLAFLTGYRLKSATLVLLFHMAGTFTPMLLFPSETFKVFPIVPTLEGQYILKNLVLLSAGLVIGAKAIASGSR
ncbi:MAG: DoxX family membrane protein [Armatimonadetes bacterium]|nr:DoxX family membrane protein [Armatimonadota bacterium]